MKCSHKVFHLSKLKTFNNPRDGRLVSAVVDIDGETEDAANVILDK